MRRLLAITLLAAAACVPADGALPTGSAEFTIFAKEEDLFLRADFFSDTRQRWNIRFDRTIISFKTVTIGQVGVPEQCSYRGRGARSNVLFDLMRGNIQTFNGIQPGDCPDVGIVLGPPDLGTTLGVGVTVADIATMVASPAAHAIVEGTATPEESDLLNADRTPYKFLLRFDTERSSSTYGGCREIIRRGVRVLPEARETSTMTFVGAALFFDSGPGVFRFQAFASADEQANADHIITMDDLDRLPLSIARGGVTERYPLRDAPPNPSFGDYVRVQLRSIFRFNDNGTCNGNPPGVE